MARQSSRGRSLEIDEDMNFQRREWTVERWFWLLLCLILACAVLGVFGGGPLSWTSVADSAGTMRVEYDRMQRVSAPGRINVSISAAAISSDGIALEVNSDFTDAMEITAIQPQPFHSVAIAGGIRFHSTPARTGRSTSTSRSSRRELGLPVRSCS